MSLDEGNSFLMGGGKTPSISWRDARPGDEVAGIIARPSRVMQQRDVKTGEPLWWDDAQTRPKNQLVVYIDTGVIDRETEDHDAVWALYVKGKSMTDAVRAAVRGSGRPGLEIGGKLTVTYTGEGVSSNRAFNPPKLYLASYIPPADPSATVLDGEIVGATPVSAPGHATATSRLRQTAQVQSNALRSMARMSEEPPF